MKKFLKHLLPAAALCLFAFCLFTLPTRAQAAGGYQKIPEYGKSAKKIGNYYFKTASTGILYYAAKKNGSYSPIGRAAGDSYTDGATVIYISSGNGYQSLISQDITAKNGAYAIKLPGTDSSGGAEPDHYSIDTYYSGRLFLGRHSFAKWKYHTYSFNVKTRKLKYELNGARILNRSGQYVVTDHSYRTDVSPFQLRIYRITATGLKQVAKLSNYAFGGVIINGYVYYANYSSIYMKKCAVYRIRLNGSGKEKLATVGYANAFVHTITAKNCLVYISGVNYRLTYSTGKLRRVS